MKGGDYMENKYVYFLTLRMSTESNPTPYITLDYEDETKAKNEPLKYNSVKLSRTIAEGLLRCFRRFSILTERSEIFPFYFTPLHYKNGSEYSVMGKYLIEISSIKKK